MKGETSRANGDLGPLSEEHQRGRRVERARRELADYYYRACSEHALTSAERTLLLAELLRDFAARMVIMERRTLS
jgi:hypothetical protein